MPVEKRNWYSNIKLVFLILFLLMFIGYAIRDYRLGNSMVGPLIFGGMLLLIAVIFKPWRQASDEGTPKKKPPSSGSAFLLAPMLMQDTTAVANRCGGMVSCHPVAVGVVAVLFGLVVYGIWRYNKAH